MSTSRTNFEKINILDSISNNTSDNSAGSSLTTIFCWLISSYSKHENQPQYSQNQMILNIIIEKNILIRLFALRVCSQSTLIIDLRPQHSSHRVSGNRFSLSLKSGYFFLFRWVSPCSRFSSFVNAPEFVIEKTCFANVFDRNGHRGSV